MLWLSQLLTQVISTQDACHYRKRQLWKPGANVTFSRFLRISNTSWNTRYRVSRQGDVREQELFLCACFPTFLYWNINDILGTNQSLSFRDASTLLELLTLTSFFFRSPPVKRTTRSCDRDGENVYHPLLDCPKHNTHTDRELNMSSVYMTHNYLFR